VAFERVGDVVASFLGERGEERLFGGSEVDQRSFTMRERLDSKAGEGKISFGFDVRGEGVMSATEICEPGEVDYLWTLEFSDS
jgi:hypothetical protein